MTSSTFFKSFIENEKSLELEGNSEIFLYFIKLKLLFNSALLLKKSSEISEKSDSM